MNMFQRNTSVTESLRLKFLLITFSTEEIQY